MKPKIHQYNMKRWLLLMTRENLAKCEASTKTQTRRDNPRYEGIKKGDEIYFRSNYKITYKTASGPYIAQSDAKPQKLRSITDEDCYCEGIGREVDEVYVRQCFKELWESIYKDEGRRWEDNPLVIRIEFKKENRGSR